MKFESLIANYTLSVQYLISKHDSRKVMALYNSSLSLVYN